MNANTDLVIESARLLLTLPDPKKAEAARDFHTQNWPHLKRWFPPIPPGFETVAYWQANAEQSRDAFTQGSMVRLWMAPKAAPDKVIGTIGYSQIFRGPFCNCVLGYQIARDFEGQGLMRESLVASIRYMFEQQKLHRIAANYRPENARSGRLLASLGFQIEGFGKRYLYIDGDWRDHVLTSLTNDQFQAEWLAVR
jgi:[ribosomal protein S5]-alanine N-acetyltransferase